MKRKMRTSEEIEALRLEMKKLRKQGMTVKAASEQLGVPHTYGVFLSYKGLVAKRKYRKRVTVETLPVIETPPRYSGILVAFMGTPMQVAEAVRNFQ